MTAPAARDRSAFVALPPYVLVTAARDEEDAIGATMDAVAAQTTLPVRWVIVSDGSTDGTDDVIRERAARMPFVQLVRVDRDGPASFAAKAVAVSTAYAALEDARHQFVGNLDADVTVPPDYYERLLALMEVRPGLGITGGVVVEDCQGRRRRQRSSPRSVAGAGQLFRRQCWYDVGTGYLPLEGGGEDAVAEILARAHGWEVEAAPALDLVHHGPVLGGANSVLSARLHRGRLNWRLGYLASFQLVSSLSRLTERPRVAGSVATLLGYASGAARRLPKTPPDDVVRRLRYEQGIRLAGAVGPVAPAVLAAAVSW